MFVETNNGHAAISCARRLLERVCASCTPSSQDYETKRSEPRESRALLQGEHADHTSKFSSSGLEAFKAFYACSFTCICEAHLCLIDYFEVFFVCSYLSAISCNVTFHPNSASNVAVRNRLSYRNYRNSRHDANRLMRNFVTQVPPCFRVPLEPDDLGVIGAAKPFEIPVRLGCHILSQLTLLLHPLESNRVLCALPLACVLHTEPMIAGHVLSANLDCLKLKGCSLLPVGASSFRRVECGTLFQLRRPPPDPCATSATDAESNPQLQGLLRLLCWPGVDLLLDPPDPVSGVKSIVLLPAADSLFLFASLWT